VTKPEMAKGRHLLSGFLACGVEGRARPARGVSEELPPSCVGLRPARVDRSL